LTALNVGVRSVPPEYGANVYCDRDGDAAVDGSPKMLLDEGS